MSSSRALSYAGYAGFVLIGWSAVVIPSLIRNIQHDFGQSNAAFGLFYFITALLYAGGTLAAGFLAERTSRKVTLVAGAGMACAGLVGAALAPVWPLFILLMIVESLGAGSIDATTNSLILAIFHDTRGGSLNFLHLFFGIGALSGPFIIGLLVTAGLPWRIILAIAAVAFACLGVWYLTLRMPAEHHRPEGADTQEPVGSGSLLPFLGLALTIGLYTAAETGVANWLVKFLSSQPLAVATGVLSLFWGGLAVGRLASRWLAEWMEYYAFTIGCVTAASLVLAGAVLAPNFLLSAALFALAGFFYGPVYPMLMALGGNIYSHRLSALSGGLATAGGVGIAIYPALMGVLAQWIGLQGGMIGAALLGIPSVAAILAVQRLARA